MDVEITRMSGETMRLSDHDVEARDFIVSSITVLPTYAKIDGRSGNVDMGASYGSRTVSVPIQFKAKDLHDFALLRDKLFDMTVSREPFYVRELRRPNHYSGHVCVSDEGDYDDTYVGGKRYLVRISADFEIDQTFRYGFGDIVFETAELPFAESIGTTAEIDNDGIIYSQELWSYGMGLLHDEESHKYTHTGTSFRIYNAGNVAVHPFEQYLVILIDETQSNVTLTNRTTGDTFKYEKPLDGKLLMLDGANITVNSLQATRNTNKQFISLAPGWNEFTLNNSARVSFRFRFYYK